MIVTPADSVPTPGTLRAVEGVSTHVGGCAANAAIDLAKLGVPVTLSCKVGRDSFGRFVRETAGEAGVDIRGIVEDGGVSTTVSIVCVNSSGERSFLYNPGSAAAYTLEDIDLRLVEECDIVFVAGAMLLASFDGEPCARFMEEARAKGKFTVMDTAWDFADVWLPKVEAVLPHLDLFMPSLEEAQKLTGEADPDRIADCFFEMGVANVIVKLGKEGRVVLPGPAGAVPAAYIPFDQTGGHHGSGRFLLRRLPGGAGPGMGFSRKRRVRQRGGNPLHHGGGSFHRHPLHYRNQGVYGPEHGRINILREEIAGEKRAL